MKLRSGWRRCLNDVGDGDGVRGEVLCLMVVSKYRYIYVLELITQLINLLL